VIELKSEIQGLENNPTQRPSTQKEKTNNNDDNLKILFEKIKPVESIKNLYNSLYERLSSEIDSFWAIIGKVYIGFYSPERAFASILISKQSIRIECFCGNNPIETTKITNERFSPRWCKFTLKYESDLELAIKILLESQRRLREALKSGETTSYFSGGETMQPRNKKQVNEE